MVVHKKKKVGKYRGGVSHGGGSRKKRRGAGSRGGRGNAGSGKRAGQKKAGLKTRKLGSKGFLPRGKKPAQVVVNVGFFTSTLLENLLKKEKVSKESDVYVIDLAKLGYEKVLGTGTISVKLRLVNGEVSAKAEEKIKAAGGNVIGWAEESSTAQEVSKEAKQPME